MAAESLGSLASLATATATATATFDSFYAAIRSSKGKLFEEGLRIAQQYGMSDFAVELQQLQSQRQTPGGEEVGGPAEQQQQQQQQRGIIMAAAAAALNGDAEGDVDSVARVLGQPFELKEIKPGFDSGIGDDSLDGDTPSCMVEASVVAAAVAALEEEEEEEGEGEGEGEGEAGGCPDKGGRSSSSSSSGGGGGGVTELVENGVQTVSVASLLSPSPPPPLPKGGKPQGLKRKGDNLDMVPSRPPSKQNQSSQSGGGGGGVP